jgi:MFS superfamily sulfate permease-like transporter
LALLVGVALVVAGVFRLGFIADLLSIPVTTGFLAGVAVHILVSQAPVLMGVAPPPGSTIDKIAALFGEAGNANPATLLIGFGVFATMLAAERISARIPGALFAIIVATLLSVALGLEAKGVEALGVLPSQGLSFAMPHVSLAEFGRLVPIALIVALVVMVQTAATTRSFVSNPARGPEVDMDFLGLGAANLLAGFAGAFPVDASPPRTAIVVETGGKSQATSLIAALLALGLATLGAGLLAHTPRAALAGVLLFVAQRIFRLGAMIDIFRRSLAEFALVLGTIAAIVILPIEQGVGVGIGLSLLHGIWTVTRGGLVEFLCLPDSTIWWPANAAKGGHTVPGVIVVALQAPLSFLNAYEFQSQIRMRATAKPDLKLIVLEAHAVVEIDYTGAKILADVAREFQDKGVAFAIARMESLRAQANLKSNGLDAVIPGDHMFHSVDEAVRSLAPQASAKFAGALNEGSTKEP